jgi:hypothetical protein
VVSEHRGGIVDEGVIDEGMRRWYRACPCCLGDAYPEIRRALDAEARLMSLDAATEKGGVEDVSEGGDAACWAHLICPGCGEVGGHRPGCPAIRREEVS